ncbi:hypothetical protein ACWE42_01235 [Sutcliffiella cohnii]|uniref:ABC transporter periplasmic binding protein yphF n=1 Tax=Sutcliffiella cohnii TaxID=33932 RepID=A0A223KS04_9BACI|nr:MULTISPECIES: hypothetical protein [Sutcliffiella]AST92259.1 hypothetical protein BC6307_13665 [Sutcliffiella cohnii]MED4017283.1 hypothetical protein [Sutcliffiella cohnii]WBL13492.1 hypothetical protein O1A01_16385 [Sutcliffiella sp. NC1]
MLFRKKWLMILFIGSTIILSGCLYPQENLKQNQVPYIDQLASVQTAVEQYREVSGGLLPIKDRDMDTPIYQKYPIDFNKLSPRYMQEPPGNAFESGGVYQYVLVDVEENPTVKLIDLRIAETIRELNLMINLYMRSNQYPPMKEVLSTDALRIDYDKLGIDSEPYIVSPFTGNNLPLILNTDGHVIIDYSMDLYTYLQEYEHSFEPGDDIRDILVENSVFVPAYSVPYTINEKNEPIFLN